MLRILDNSVFKLFGRWTQFLFLTASLIAVIVTIVSISGIGPIRPASDSIFWLLGANFILITAVAFYVGQEFFRLTSRADESRSRTGQGSLGKRFAALFSLAAVTPAVLVALFLGTSLNRGIENWFSERIQNIVEGSADIARSNLQAIADDLRVDVGIMAQDLNAAAMGFETEPDVFARFLLEQAIYRELTGASLISADGDILVASDQASRRAFIRPQDEMFETANSGDVSVMLDNESSQFLALFKLEGFDEAYLYTTRPADKRLLDSLTRAEQTVVDYRRSEESSRRLQLIFLLGFVQITALILLFFVRFGLHAASQISRPISRLATAADDVRSGDLNVTVPMPRLDNEVSELTSSFNAMTAKLREQKDAIDLAHKEALERTRFIETVLDRVTAGVIRVDNDLNITLANPSARRIFPQLHETGAPQNLPSTIPEFAGLVRDAQRDKVGREQTLMIERDGAQKHVFLRVAPTVEKEAACILTFDDTTRLISAQRQSAWRDVARRIAHEIRNPLTPIQLSAERLKRRYRKLIDDDDVVFDKCTDTILRQVSDIGHMVEEFSSFARMPKPELKTFDLVEMARSSVFGMRLSLPDVDVRMETDAESLPVKGDERLLSQALTNLIKNAGEAISRLEQDLEDDDQAGEILVRVQTLQDNYVLVEVEDTGPGFPVENRSQYLEPYFTTREQGVGLGLAIVNRIVQDHSGQLTLLDRSDGKPGARVSVRLPTSGPSDESVSSWNVSEERV
ncbi:MAG: PAS domain-containing sensor histidine kinase [Ponticaulis sp.]|nr:PAS domain-containing sensor histidine kinase [Ponticaulis sp.]